MRVSVRAKRIGAGTAYTVIFVGSVVFHVVSTIVVSVLVLLGLLPMDTPESVAGGSLSPHLFLFAYLVVGLILSPLWVGALWLTVWPGLWLYSLVRPMRIDYVANRDE